MNIKKLNSLPGAVWNLRKSWGFSDTSVKQLNHPDRIAGCMRDHDLSGEPQ